jgi:hypothetical protein
MGLKTAFWIFTGIILYAYLGYTLLLLIVAFFQQYRRLNLLSPFLYLLIMRPEALRQK